MAQIKYGNDKKLDKIVYISEDISQKTIPELLEKCSFLLEIQNQKKI